MMTRSQAWTTIAAVVFVGVMISMITAQPAFAQWRNCTALRATNTLGYAGSAVVRIVTGSGADSLVAAADRAERDWYLQCR